MTEQEYRTRKGINKSTLWEIRRSPAHYKYLLEHPTEDTPALRFGRALHAAILTPAAFKREYVVAPDCDRRTKEGKETYALWQSNLTPDMTILSADDMQTIQGMVKSYQDSKEARALLRNTRREVPKFWTDPETGLLCKCRIDAIKTDAVVDLKTTLDASTDAFTRDAMRYGYHVQAAHYLQGVEATIGRRPEWYFLVIEKKPPYCVHIMHASSELIDLGAYERACLMEKLKHCIDTDTWPAYAAEELTAPAWAYTEVT